MAGTSRRSSMTVLLAAFECDPTKGSEASNGWNWATGLAGKGFEVHCFTRGIHRQNISSHPYPANLHFHFILLPLQLEKLYLTEPTLYVYYMLWQWQLYRKARRLARVIRFHVAHHVTWGSLQMGSFLYKLKVPFIFGPAGGGQFAPAAFKAYFGQYWTTEQRRAQVSRWLLRCNPACRQMIKKAHAVIVSNRETEDMVCAMGARHRGVSLDAALPPHFFPESFAAKQPAPGRLRLLWTGRMMPRKGLLLLLEVMRALKHTAGITLTMVGDGEMKSAVTETIAAYALAATVTLIGEVPYSEIKQYYATHDVFFFTSLRDSCPAQLIEAMAYGLPVVTLHLHGQAMIVNENTGFRVPCATPAEAIDGLARAILQLYYTPALVSRMSVAAHAHAKEQVWVKKIDEVVGKWYGREG